MKPLQTLLFHIPEPLRTQLEPLGAEQGIQELRLRVGQVPCINQNGAFQYMVCLPPCGQKMLDECFYALCNYSLHSVEQELQQGYFTTPQGIRVGVSGVFQRQNGQVQLVRLYSLNLRLPSFCAYPLREEIAALLKKPFEGILILGPPGCGKTTILRQIARLLSKGGRPITVIDERKELLPEGVEPGGLDLLAGLPKAEAMQMALRSLAPDCFVLDELGNLEEVCAMEQALAGGTAFVASMHAGSFAQAERRPQMQRLLANGHITCAVLMGTRETPGLIKEIKRYNE